MKTFFIHLAKILLLVEPRANRHQKKTQKELDSLRGQSQKQDWPLISILLPVYNVAQYLPRCLDSLLSQTYPQLEVICVNDASTDDSLAVLQAYAARSPQIKIVNKTTNEGLPQARQSALAQAAGKWVLNADSDDWLEPTMIEDLYLLTQHGSAKSDRTDMIYCDYVRNETIIRAAKIPEDKLQRILKRSFAFGNTIWNRLIKREILEQVTFPTANMGEDLVINTQLYVLADKIVYCAKPLYHHRYLDNQSSISAAHSQKNFAEMLKNYELVADFCREKFGRNKKIERLYQKRVAYIRDRIRKVG